MNFHLVKFEMSCGLANQLPQSTLPEVVFAGRSNVGKSSLTNRILGQQRVIVSNVAGTTRDATDTVIENEYGKYIFIDTAGIRRKAKVEDAIERYSVLRSYMAVDRCDVAIILIDAVEGFSEQDSKIAGYAHEQGKACIIVVNKWDAVEGKETNTMELQRRGYAECFSFMGYAPIIFISAQTGYNVNKLMQLIRDLAAKRNMTIIFIEHDMDIVFNYADEISVLRDGELIASGTPDEIKQNEYVQQAYLGGDMS